MFELTKTKYLLLMKRKHGSHSQHLRPCSHDAKFCLFCKKICEREAISSVNDFLHPPKFLQEQRNFKDSVDYKIVALEAVKILSGEKNPLFLDIHLSLGHQISLHMNYEANATV